MPTLAERKTKLMLALWELSEEMEKIGNERDRDMLEVAGNIVEDTFCVGNGRGLCITSIQEVFENKENVSARAGWDLEGICNDCRNTGEDCDSVCRLENTEKDISALSCKGCVFFSSCELPTHPADCLMYVKKESK